MSLYCRRYGIAIVGVEAQAEVSVLHVNVLRNGNLRFVNSGTEGDVSSGQTNNEI